MGRLTAEDDDKDHRNRNRNRNRNSDSYWAVGKMFIRVRLPASRRKQA